MKHYFMLFLAVFFPWLVLLIKDNPGGAFIALVLQATAIGWIPASAWAWRLEKEDFAREKEEAFKKRKK